MPFMWRGKHHIAISQLIKDFGCYPYLPRLKNADVLIQAIQKGFGLKSWLQDSFAYAESFDELSGRYRGLRPGDEIISITSNDSGLLVIPEAGMSQIEAETPAPSDASTGSITNFGAPPFHQKLHLLLKLKDILERSCSIPHALAVMLVRLQMK